MSQESVELATPVVDAFNRRDLDAFAEHCTADVEWFPSLAGTIEGSSYKGREGMERYFEDYNEAWERFMVDNDESRVIIAESGTKFGTKFSRHPARMTE